MGYSGKDADEAVAAVEPQAEADLAARPRAADRRPPEGRAPGAEHPMTRHPGGVGPSRSSAEVAW
ncbi:hypothetical protein ACFSTC_22695 [Nonomuraea ferruginea]